MRLGIICVLVGLWFGEVPGFAGYITFCVSFCPVNFTTSL